MEQKLDRLLSGACYDHVLPFLWLHGEDEATLREYMAAIYNANIRAVCVESRPHPEFLGEGWWRDLDILLDEARCRGMRLWILDDSHFPTGWANGTLKHADSGLCRQFLTRMIVEAGSEIPPCRAMVPRCL